VPFYHDVLKNGVLNGFSAYCDFWFPYPPLSLPLVYGPGLISFEYGHYRAAFQVEMMAFDVATYVLLWAFLRKRLDCRPWMCAASLALYSAIGLFVGHLLFDRLDVVMSASYLGAVFFATGKGKTRWIAYAFLLAGTLVKILPLFLLPLFAIIERFRLRDRTWPTDAAALSPFALVALPFVLVIGFYHRNICDQVMQSLSQHGVRGIQIESNWALPLLAAKVLRGTIVETDFSFGAFHIFGSGVPAWYVWLSKRAGFAILAAYYYFVNRWFRRNTVDADRLDPMDVSHLVYGVILLIISTQRVLSPQYLIWLMPLAAMQLATADRKGAVVAGVAVLFALSYAVFDKGFREILNFDPTFTLVLLIRNVLLAVWTVDMLRLSCRAVRRHRRSAVEAILA
jgi:hypothetical protein